MTDVSEAEGWARGLDELAERLAPRFGRVEPRRRALAYLRGLLAPVGRKNGWQLAEAAGDRDAGRDAGLPRAGCAGTPTRSATTCGPTWSSTSATPARVLVLDETGFVKKGDEVGRRAAAVQRHRGPRRELPGRRLPRLRQPARPGADRPRALPARGLGGRRGPPRRGGRAGGVAFATKPKLGAAMLERALDAGVPCAWVTGDSVYGADRALRRRIEARGGLGYVLARDQRPAAGRPARGRVGGRGAAARAGSG